MSVWPFTSIQRDQGPEASRLRVEVPGHYVLQIPQATDTWSRASTQRFVHIIGRVTKLDADRIDLSERCIQRWQVPVNVIARDFAALLQKASGRSCSAINGGPMLWRGGGG